LFRRRIGEGAFGVVWEAYDTERGARVALKALTRTEPSSLYLFKREFRALADIVHPNLVTLYELLNYGDRWFFTMEFIEGVDFVEHVRGITQPSSRSSAAETVTILRSGPVDRPPPPPEMADPTISYIHAPPGPNPWYDQPTLDSASVRDELPLSVQVLVSAPRGGVFREDLARAALAQLAEGLSTLHAAGKLHRDIKPSNVLVANGGRLVILDFGLITELWPTGVHRETQAIVGTPAFMSPEQSLGKSLTPASDWYAVGVMLYVALTGRLPFDGQPLQVLFTKQRQDPPAPSSFVTGLPADLESLCMDLLRRKPEERPSGEEVLRRLGVSAAASRGRPVDRRVTFVGREAELARLKEGFQVTQQTGKPAAAIVHGASGLGKSALVQAFVRSLRHEEPEALVLAGRCFSRESVPYKAVDGVIDELSVYLQLLAPGRTAVLMPRGADALLRIFPVLRQVESVAPPTLRAHTIASEVELRRRAFAALRELLGRIAERKPLVLVLDDLQWSDADSDALLAEILRAPDAPPIFVLATFRLDEVDGTPLARTLRAEGVDTRVVTLDPLPAEKAQELALLYIGPDEARAAAIARESAGNPFFVEVLSDHVTMLRGVDDRSPDSVVRVDLRDVFGEKMSRLPEPARKLLETVAVAGHPIPVIPAWRAAEVSLPDQSMLSLLLLLHLLRSHTDVGLSREEIEPYHERIRDAVLAGLTPEQIRHRRERIALALEAAGGTDPEVLASHFEAAGRMLEAGRYALLAANQSAAALAFDRAARLYRWALSLAPSSDDAQILGQLGDALANAGRGGEAADAYLAAARGTASSGALEMRRRAAEQLLISGHTERGMEVVKLVLSSLGMKLAQTREGSIVNFLAGRARLKLRGFSFKERPASEIPPEQLLRVDAAWALAVGLAMVDSVRSADFQCRQLLFALDAGEPYRIARALALEVAYSATSGPKSWPRTAELVERSLDMARRINHPHALGLATTMSGAARYLAGRWREGFDALERGAQILREQCTGVTWELDTAEIFVFSALQMSGRWKELSERYDEFMRSARARGDRYAETHAMLETAWYVEIARDRPEAARHHIELAFSRTKTEVFEVHDFLYVMGTAFIELYAGTPEPALERLEAAWPRLRRALIFEIYLANIELHALRARTRIACAALPHVSGKQRERLLREAEKDIVRVEEGSGAWTRASAALLRACCASVRRHRAEALEMLDRADKAYAGADTEHYAAATRIRMGQLLGGDRGAALVAEGTDRLKAQGVKAPEKVARMVSPGHWD
jgi:serine/threonine protein kinase